MTHFILKPHKLLTNPSELFNMSSIDSFLNIFSMIIFLIISVFRNKIPKDQLLSWYVYSGIFFVMLSILLNENNIIQNPPDQKPPAGLPEPFTDNINISDVVLV